MRSPDFYSGLLWALIGAYIAYDGRDMGLGTINDPGSGFILFWVGCAMVAMSGATAIFALIKKQGKTIPDLFRGMMWGKVILLLIVITVYSAVLDHVGFVPATLVMLLVLFRAIEPLTWPFAIFSSVITTGIIWYVFGPHVLGTQFPTLDMEDPMPALWYAIPGLVVAAAILFHPGAPKPKMED